ncbi:MAG: hypothetical protein HYZ72_08245, partial [Deltaproteobacteria bacterium]|nr:hypothetical protein [Deltaproteobacteria bacterium]
KFSAEAAVGYRGEVSFDPLAGTFSGSIGGFGGFSQELAVADVEVLGEGRVDLTGTRAITLAGCAPVVLTPSWEISLEGKAGIGAPAVLAVDVIFPPASPLARKFHTPGGIF